MAPPNAYEAARLEKIKKNEALLADLALKTRSIVPLSRSSASNKSRARTRSTADDEDDDDDGEQSRPAKKQRRTGVSSLLGGQSAPARASARIAAAPKKQYHESNGQEGGGVPDEGAARQSRRQSSKTNRHRESRQQTSRDISERTPSRSPSIPPSPSIASIQENWTNWQPTAPPPSRNTEGGGDATFHFADQPLFTPNKSPEEMLRQGVFGGSYYRPLRSRKLGITISDDWRELPAEWLTNLNKERYLYSATYDPEVNFFGVACGQSIEEWEAAGWIAHEFDVRGWFQWYTRFFRGRRCADDERQVSRWRKCVGPTGRWRRTLLKKYLQLGVREVWDLGDEDDDDDDGGRGGRAKQVSPVVHQTCLHWAFEVRQGHLDEIWENGGV